MFKMADRSTDEDFASYYDSDQFDEDSMSICSWFSEHNSISAITWKGWKRNANITREFHSNCLTIATVRKQLRLLPGLQNMSIVEQFHTSK